MTHKIKFFPGKPIYQQISDYLRREIYSGRLKEGQSLPSVRSPAITNSVNPMTVSKALSTLHKEGVLLYVAGKSFVVATVEVDLSGKLSLIHADMVALVYRAKQLGCSGDELVAALQGELMRVSCEKS